MINYRSFAGGLGNNLFQFAYIYTQARKGLIPDIYLQDPKYFEGCAEEIRALYGQGVEPIDMVSIHVRRGKNPAVPNEPAYSDNPFVVNLCKTDYYTEAMNQFPGEKFLLFTDDKEFCRVTFPDIQMYEGKDEIEDFNAMAGCRGHIIANSSFSWWAAFVGGGKTVAPKNWYTDGVERTKTPDNWIRI